MTSANYSFVFKIAFEPNLFPFQESGGRNSVWMERLRNHWPKSS